MTEPDGPNGSVGPNRRNVHGFTAHAEVADWYNKKYVEMSGGWHTPIEELDHHLYELGLPSDARGMTLVDLGCGDGQLLARAVLSGAVCVGVEISEVGRQMTARRMDALIGRNDSVRANQLGLTGASMEQTGLPDGWFDFAISLGSMEHSVDVEASVKEMARILKPGGRWLLYVPNELWIHQDQPLETTAPSSWWIGLCEAAGLVIGNDEEINDNNRITGIKPRHAQTEGGS